MNFNKFHNPQERQQVWKGVREDVAETAAFLPSDKNSWVAGAIVVVLGVVKAVTAVAMQVKARTIFMMMMMITMMRMLLNDRILRQ